MGSIRTGGALIGGMRHDTIQNDLSGCWDFISAQHLGSFMPGHCMLRHCTGINGSRSNPLRQFRISVQDLSVA